MADIYFQIVTSHCTEHKWIIVSEKGLINDKIVVWYHKYFKVCNPFVKMVKFMLAKKMQIFKIKQLLFCHIYMIYNRNILEIQFHDQNP